MSLGITVDMVIDAKAGDYLKKLQQQASEPDGPEEPESEKTGNRVKDKAKAIAQKSKEKIKQQKEALKQKAKDYKDKLKAAVKDQIQNMIDKLDAKFEAVKASVQGISNGAASLVAASVTADPMAPAATTGVISSAMGTASALKGQLDAAENSLVEVESGIKELLGDIPSVVGVALGTVKTSIKGIILP